MCAGGEQLAVHPRVVFGCTVARANPWDKATPRGYDSIGSVVEFQNHWFQAF
jgi:hypothetical protein